MAAISQARKAHHQSVTTALLANEEVFMYCSMSGYNNSFVLGNDYHMGGTDNAFILGSNYHMRGSHSQRILLLEPQRATFRGNER